VVSADAFSGILRDLVAAGVVVVAGSASVDGTLPQLETGRDAGGQHDGRRWGPQQPIEVPPQVAPVGPPRFGTTGRIPVFSFWATDEGPHHGAAAVVAYARVAFGGSLNEHFELVRTHPAER